MIFKSALHAFRAKYAMLTLAQILPSSAFDLIYLEDIKIVLKTFS